MSKHISPSPWRIPTVASMDAHARFIRQLIVNRQRNVPVGRHRKENS